MLPLPLRETILRFNEDFRIREEKLRGAKKDRNALADASARTMNEIRKIEYSGEVPTEMELEQVRKSRDVQWQLLRRQWLEGEDVTLEIRSFTENDDLPHIYENHVKMADHLGDRLRREANRVHEFAALKADQFAHEETQKTIRLKMETLEAESATLSKNWKILWQPCAIQQLPPKEMLDWCEKFEKIHLGALELKKIEREINSRKTEREKLRNALLRGLENLEKSWADKDETLEPVLVFCETLLDDLDRKRKDRQKLMDKQKDLHGDLKTARRHEETAREELAHWQERWRESAVLPNNAEKNPDAPPSALQPEGANDILESLKECFAKLKEADELQKRIEGIDRDAKDFVREVQALVKEAAPELKGLQPEQAVVQLQILLKENLEQKTLLRKYTRETEAMPFIVDDILVNFDDDRARATLAALADPALGTQVILFTHHRRIAEEAEKMADKAPMELHYI